MPLTAPSFTPEGLTCSAQHEYALKGRSQVGVTAALRAVGLIDLFSVEEADRQRGTAVAAAIEQWHRDHQPPDLPAVWMGYFEAYLSFFGGVGFDVDAVEELVCDPTIGCAGRLDLRGRFRDGSAAVVDVIDVKTGAVPPWVGYQTAGYARLLPPHVRGKCRRWVLQLRTDGFALIPLTKRSDEQVFLAAVTVALARRGWL